MNQLHIRWAIRRDMPSILAIEQASFDYPWTEEELINCLRCRNCIGMVAEHNEQVVGYMVYSITSAHLLLHNLAVHPDHRRRYVGHRLVRYLQTKLTRGKRKWCLLEIRESNLAGQLFFRSQGFRATEILKSWYETGEDAYQMCYERVSKITQADLDRLFYGGVA